MTDRLARSMSQDDFPTPATLSETPTSAVDTLNASSLTPAHLFSFSAAGTLPNVVCHVRLRVAAGVPEHPALRAFRAPLLPLVYAPVAALGMTVSATISEISSEKVTVIA